MTPVEFNDWVSTIGAKISGISSSKGEMREIHIKTTTGEQLRIVPEENTLKLKEFNP